MRNLARIVVIALTAAMSVSAVKAGDVVRGQRHFVVCQACHGGNGEGNKSIGAPRLAGQFAWYVARELQYFRDGARGAKQGDAMGEVMVAQAKALPDMQAVEDVAAYVETLEAPAEERTELSGDPTAGKAGYLACQFCHGERGEGSTVAWAPRLAQQHDWYLIRQVRNFRAGLRGYHADDAYGQGMRAMAATLPSDQALLKNSLRCIGDTFTMMPVVSRPAPPGKVVRYRGIAARQPQATRCFDAGSYA